MFELDLIRLLTAFVDLAPFPLGFGLMINVLQMHKILFCAQYLFITGERNNIT